jgi:HAD superfamily phosphoserine phosphatase-like hydrolase
MQALSRARQDTTDVRLEKLEGHAVSLYTAIETMVDTVNRLGDHVDRLSVKVTAWWKRCFIPIAISYFPQLRSAIIKTISTRPWCRFFFCFSSPRPSESSAQKRRFHMERDYLFISDFDQTLSFNDSGIVLSELLGVSDFEARIAGLSRIHLVQQGGELAYLLLHDPDYRRVRREHLVEVGRRIRLKQNIHLMSQLLQQVEGHRFLFYVLSAAPEEVIQSALEGIVPPERIYGTRFRYDESSGEIQSIVRVPAGYGKVAVLEELRAELQVGANRVVYVGDGSSDVHVMLHVNRLGGLTIAVSENHYITQIAARTILSDDALSVAIPILEDIAGWSPKRIRALFESEGFVLHEWGKTRTDALTITRTVSAAEARV